MIKICPKCKGAGIQAKKYARNNLNEWFTLCYKCSGTGKIQVPNLKKFIEEMEKDK